MSHYEFKSLIVKNSLGDDGLSTLGTEEVIIAYGYDKALGYFLDITPVKSEEDEPLYQFAQYEFVGFNLVARTFEVKQTWFNGDVLATMLELYGIPTKYIHHLAQARTLTLPKPQEDSENILTKDSIDIETFLKYLYNDGLISETKLETEPDK